jgi:hypothetical protein
MCIYIYISSIVCIEHHRRWKDTIIVRTAESVYASILMAFGSSFSHE